MVGELAEAVEEVRLELMLHAATALAGLGRAWLRLGWWVLGPLPVPSRHPARQACWEFCAKEAVALRRSAAMLRHEVERRRSER